MPLPDRPYLPSGHAAPPRRGSTCCPMARKREASSSAIRTDPRAGPPQYEAAARSTVGTAGKGKGQIVSSRGAPGASTSRISPAPWFNTARTVPRGLPPRVHHQQADQVGMDRIRRPAGAAGATVRHKALHRAVHRLFLGVDSLDPRDQRARGVALDDQHPGKHAPFRSSAACRGGTMSAGSGAVGFPRARRRGRQRRRRLFLRQCGHLTSSEAGRSEQDRPMP